MTVRPVHPSVSRLCSWCDRNGKYVDSAGDYYCQSHYQEHGCNHHGTPHATRCDKCDPAIRDLSQRISRGLGI